MSKPQENLSYLFRKEHKICITTKTKIIMAFGATFLRAGKVGCMATQVTVEGAHHFLLRMTRIQGGWVMKECLQR
nr:hypothetical protein Iba_chr04cCG7500 [Ipomoea batatas]GMC85832.1 hypothetical protein Iba_chr04dCG5130 [Ipomoea batatas]GMC88341.1 hypothetical protein Iba_chr04eCG9200 [Ipomoea batatas]